MWTLFGTEAYGRNVATKTPGGLWVDQRLPPQVVDHLGAGSDLWLSLQLKKPVSGVCRADPGRPFVPELLSAESTLLWWEGLTAFCQSDILFPEISIHWAMPPLAYYPTPEAGELIHELLTRHGATMVSMDVNQHLTLDPNLGRVEWTSSLPADQRRHVRYWADRTAFIDHDTDWQGAYQLIAQNRKNRGWDVSLSLDALVDLAAKFPDHYHLHTLRMGKSGSSPSMTVTDLLACIVLVKVNEQIAYSLYTASHEGYRDRAPLIALMAQTVDVCRRQGIVLLDLGTSSVPGSLNKGVYAFKKSLGAVDSPKYRWGFSSQR